MRRAQAGLKGIDDMTARQPPTAARLDASLFAVALPCVAVLCGTPSLYSASYPSFP